MNFIKEQKVVKLMHCIDVPQRDYIVFSHPPFDYEIIGSSVGEAVDTACNNYDFINAGYGHDKTAMTYQMHNPEHIGYRLYVPVKPV